MKYQTTNGKCLVGYTVINKSHNQKEHHMFYDGDTRIFRAGTETTIH